MPNIQHKRGTRAALDALAASNGLLVGQIYVITDENRLALATAVNAYTAFLKEGEGGGGGQTQRVAQIRNSAATSNLNHGTAWADIVIDGIEDEMDSSDFENGPTGIIAKFTDRCKVTTVINYTVAGTRVNVRVRSAVGGVGQPIMGKMGYVRNTSGHNEATCIASQYVDVIADEEITLQTSREASATQSTPGDAGACMLLVERWA